MNCNTTHYRANSSSVPGDPTFNELLRLATAKSPAFQADILNGTAEGLAGWRKATKPAGWDAFAAKLERSTDIALRNRVHELGVVFGDGRALADVTKVALDKEADAGARRAALQALIDVHAPELRPTCERLLDDRTVNGVAVRGLAGFDDPAVGVRLVKAFRQFDPSEHGQVMSALVSRPAFARALLDAVESGRIPRTEISPFHARQIRGLGDAELNTKLAKVWGEFRDPSREKQRLLIDWRARLTPAGLAKADKSQGRVVFNTACAPCHTLYNEGGKVGPDLTGSGRHDLDYLLENILDPSAVVAADLRMSILDLKDGRVLNGIIAAKTERTLTVKTMTETLTLERGEITRIQDSPLSLMPEGLLEALTFEQARDLIAYLMHPSQVPLPSAATRSGSN